MQYFVLGVQAWNTLIPLSYDKREVIFFFQYAVHVVHLCTPPCISGDESLPLLPYAWRNIFGNEEYVTTIPYHAVSTVVCSGGNSSRRGAMLVEGVNHVRPAAPCPGGQRRMMCRFGKWNVLWRNGAFSSSLDSRCWEFFFSIYCSKYT